MPGFDGTGPFGQGPMTGRGNGYCVVPVNYVNYPNPTRNYPIPTPLYYANLWHGVPRRRLYARTGWRSGRGFGGGRWW